MIALVVHKEGTVERPNGINRTFLSTRDLLETTAITVDDPNLPLIRASSVEYYLQSIRRPTGMAIQAGIVSQLPVSRSVGVDDSDIFLLLAGAFKEDDPLTCLVNLIT